VALAKRGYNGVLNGVKFLSRVQRNSRAAAAASDQVAREALRLAVQDLQGLRVHELRRLAYQDPRRAAPEGARGERSSRR